MVNCTATIPHGVGRAIDYLQISLMIASEHYFVTSDKCLGLPLLCINE